MRSARVQWIVWDIEFLVTLTTELISLSLPGGTLIYARVITAVASSDSSVRRRLEAIVIA